MRDRAHDHRGRHRFLERVPTLRLLGRDALRILAIGAESRYVHSGEVLFIAGEAADGGYRRAGGLVQARRPTATSGGDGHRRAAARCSANSRCSPRRRGRRPRPRVEPSTVMRIPRSLFLKMLEGYPGRRACACATRSWRARARQCDCARDDPASVRGDRSIIEPDAGAAALNRVRRQTSSVAVTGTWSDGRSQPRASLRDLRCRRARSRERLRRPRCGRAGGPCRRLPSRARDSSTRCRASPAPARSMRATSIQPPAFCARGELLAFDRRVRDDVQHLLVAPDVVLERRDVEIADQDGALGRAPAACRRSRASRRGTTSLCANFGLTAGSGSSPPAGT